MVTSSRQVTGGFAVPEKTWYQYDSKGKRLRKIAENQATSGTGTPKNMRIYIEGYEYFENFTNGKTTHSLSLIDQGSRFVMFEKSYDSTATPSPTTTILIRYQHPNHQASCCLETNDTGDIITYEEYHPFGTTSYQAKSTNITAAAKRYRYTGMERDDETGLSYHNARYYIPWLGRWLSPDPIGLEGGKNCYEYCHSNPVTYSDTAGTQINEKYIAQRVSTLVFKDIPKDLKFLTTAGRQAIAEKREMNRQERLAELIAKNPTPSGEVYGKEDSRFWMTKENYAPDRANHIEFQKQYKEASGFTAFSMWFNYAGVPLITAAAVAGVVAKGIQAQLLMGL